MNNVLSPAQMDKHNFWVYLVLFDLKKDVPEKTLESIAKQFYNLRLTLPDVMTVRIKKDAIPSKSHFRYTCLITYANPQALEKLLDHAAYKSVYMVVQQASRSVTEFATRLGYFYSTREGISIRLATPQKERLDKTVEERLKLIVRDELHLAEQHVTLDASWVTELDADSIDLINLISAVEDEFGISIPDEEAEKIVTTRDALNFLAERGIQ